MVIQTAPTPAGYLLETGAARRFRRGRLAVMLVVVPLALAEVLEAMAVVFFEAVVAEYFKALVAVLEAVAVDPEAVAVATMVQGVVRTCHALVHIVSF